MTDEGGRDDVRGTIHLGDAHFRLDSNGLHFDLRSGQYLVARLKLTPNELEWVESVEVIVRGYRKGDALQVFRSVPAMTLEDIARYVAGDGGDPQRVALADGIRSGRHAEK